MSLLLTRLHSPFPRHTGTRQVPDTHFPHPGAEHLLWEGGEDPRSRCWVLQGHKQQLQLLATTIKRTKLGVKPWP